MLAGSQYQQVDALEKIPNKIRKIRISIRRRKILNNNRNQNTLESLALGRRLRRIASLDILYVAFQIIGAL